MPLRPVAENGKRGYKKTAERTKSKKRKNGGKGNKGPLPLAPLKLSCLASVPQREMKRTTNGGGKERSSCCSFLVKFPRSCSTRPQREICMPTFLPAHTCINSIFFSNSIFQSSEVQKMGHALILGENVSYTKRHGIVML